MRRVFVVGALVLSATMLSACSSLNSQFDCPNQAGVRCKSLDKINDMVNAGELPKHANGCDSGLSTNYISHAWGRWKPIGCGGEKIVVSGIQFESGASFASIQGNDPYRTPEKVSRVWIAAYEDTQGNYHQDTMIYTVSEKSHWGVPLIEPIIYTNEQSLLKGESYVR